MRFKKSLNEEENSATFGLCRNNEEDRLRIVNILRVIHFGQNPIYFSYLGLRSC